MEAGASIRPPDKRRDTRALLTGGEGGEEGEGEVGIGELLLGGEIIEHDFTRGRGGGGEERGRVNREVKELKVEGVSVGGGVEGPLGRLRAGGWGWGKTKEEEEGEEKGGEGEQVAAQRVFRSLYLSASRDKIVRRVL